MTRVGIELLGQLKTELKIVVFYVLWRERVVSKHKTRAKNGTKMKTGNFHTAFPKWVDI